jgi:8-oxo-dGTP diphosphatase
MEIVVVVHGCRVEQVRRHAEDCAAEGSGTAATRCDHGGSSRVRGHGHGGDVPAVRTAAAVLESRVVKSRLLRLAAYGICVVDDRLLLARYVSPDATERHWTLPGGRVEHGEDPYDAVVREVAEETGYAVEVTRLLGVDSRTRHVRWLKPFGGELHSVGVFYEVAIGGGELRYETDGSTDMAAWIPAAEVAGLERTVIVDLALSLRRGRPATGHVDPIEVGGLLRH